MYIIKLVTDDIYILKNGGFTENIEEAEQYSEEEANGICNTSPLNLTLISVENVTE